MHDNHEGMTGPRRAQAFVASTVAGLVCLHVFLLLTGFGEGGYGWPFLVAGVGLLIAASGWGDPPVDRAAFVEAGRVLGWRHGAGVIVGRFVVVMALLLILSAATLFL